jgi:ABC-2 type transport system ATP-binding protein
MMLLSAQNVVKRYANHTALNKVSLDVPEGSVFGLLGPNGAGKTTLIRIINQITGPDEGEVWFNGERLNAAHVAQIGYLPEERGLYKKMKVGEQALYLAQLKGVSHAEALKRLKFWFNKFEINTWWNRKVEELSKGMQQKVQFIVTVIHQPRLLIFDEPFSGFDPINVNLLKNEILNLKANGATIIFSTHNMASVEELCDNIALINKSEKILEGNVREIRNRFRQNVFEVETNVPVSGVQAKLPTDFIVEKEIVNHDHTKLILRIPTNVGSNELLASLMAHTSIKSFKELLPTMDEIFIQAVNTSNT